MFKIYVAFLPARGISVRDLVVIVIVLGSIVAAAFCAAAPSEDNKERDLPRDQPSAEYRLISRLSADGQASRGNVRPRQKAAASAPAWKYISLSSNGDAGSPNRKLL